MFTLYIKNNDGISIHWYKTENECMEFLTRTKAIKYKIVPVSEQKNLRFSNALKYAEQDQDFVIDMNLAKEIKLNELRLKRDLYFDKLDKIYFKALQLNDLDQEKKVISLKQQLRDFTHVELPNNEDDLDAFIPQVFKDIDDLTF